MFSLNLLIYISIQQTFIKHQSRAGIIEIIIENQVKVTFSHDEVRVRQSTHWKEIRHGLGSQTTDFTDRYKHTTEHFNTIPCVQ